MLRVQLAMIRRGELERTVALDAARREIATRLRRVCEDFDDADFIRLVNRMAEIEVRYRLREDWSLSDPTRRISFS